MTLLMITNRVKDKNSLGTTAGPTLYFEHAGGPVDKLANWKPFADQQAFKDRLVDIASQFPEVPEDHNEDQKHINFFVHGFNNSWEESAIRYSKLQANLFDKSDLGQSILYSWPSNGSPLGYLPDREDARGSAQALAAEFVTLHDYLIAKQRVVAKTQDPTKACRAKVSVIAHSMGNYVVQKALAIAAKQLNSPQLLTLITQLAMVAADVDNDLFQRDKPEDSDGALMANLCYRICAMYTGLDQVLGASAGLKHFGTRRLGRSGLADPNNVWDNVFDIDVTSYIVKKDIHSAVFDSPRARTLLENVLRGVDRGVLLSGKAAAA